MDSCSPADELAAEWHLGTLARMGDAARAERRAELDGDEDLLELASEWWWTLAEEYEQQTGKPIHTTIAITVPADEKPITGPEASAIIERLEAERPHVLPSDMAKILDAPRDRVVVVRHYAQRGGVMRVRRTVYQGEGDVTPRALLHASPRCSGRPRARGSGRPRGRRVVSRSAGGGSSGDPDEGEPAGEHHGRRSGHHQHHVVLDLLRAGATA
jgi:hypothetical protein